MSNIIPKLNLNRVPSLTENNSLVYAKNIRIDLDKSIHRDYSILPLSIKHGTNVSGFVNYGNIMNRILEDLKYAINNIEYITFNINIDLYNTIINRLEPYVSITNTDEGNVNISTTAKIVGQIASTNEIYFFIRGVRYIPKQIDKAASKPPVKKAIIADFIICYKEEEDRFEPCNCKWSYNNGKIYGCVINNLRGDKILNIAESSNYGLIPFKSINLSKSSIYDDESIYTQSPNIPLINLNSNGKFKYSIPNGTYQFFIRYEIRNNFYTNWYPASKELFAYNSIIDKTNFGTVKYCNIHKDSDFSFVFNVEHICNDDTFEIFSKYYKRFQIGFICSHDDSVVARAWKHFSINDNNIYFDYNALDSKEIEITDLLNVTYNLYNVGNITSFKNKLYISNYNETNFNIDNSEYANNIDIELTTLEGKNIDDSIYSIKTIQGIDYIDGIKYGNHDTYIPISGSTGIIYDILNNSKTANGVSFIDELKALFIANTEDYIYHTLDGKEIKVTDASLSFNNTIGDITGKSDNLKPFSNKPAESNNIRNVKYNISDVRIDDDIHNVGLWPDVNSIVNKIITRIVNKIKYIGTNKVLYDENLKPVYNFKLVFYRTYEEFSWVSEGAPSIDDIPSISKPDDDKNSNDINNDKNNQIVQDVINPKPNGTKQWVTNTYMQYVTINFNTDINLEIGEINRLTDFTTLIPEQYYKFYVHYIKNTGEITNGILCGTSNVDNSLIYSTDETKTYKVLGREKCDVVIYPIFKNIEIPKGYQGCFFSILHTKNKVSVVTNINEEGEGQNIEADMRLSPIYRQFDTVIYTGEKSNSVTSNYYASADSTYIRYFGACGIVKLELSNLELDENSIGYIIDKYNSPSDEDSELIKCTPYIGESNLSDNIYNNYNQLNLTGYFCNIYLLNKEATIKYFTDGSTIYKKLDDYTASTYNKLSFKELSKYLGTNGDKLENTLNEFKYINKESDIRFVYSNYNLNCITLTDDIKTIIKTGYKREANTTTSSGSESDNDNAISFYFKVFPSLILSDIYMLPSMYRNYTRKTYVKLTTNAITRFDNTVRSSILIGDEDVYDITRFDAEDYYNIPTNRGIITNLIGIGDAILVHTKDSMFKFTGSNNLQSTQGEIQPNETQPFNTGVSEVFGSDYGFAGLQNKDESIITELGYIFFDRDARVIYIYSGNGQMVKLTDNIDKLIKNIPITNLAFANDYYNNRFYISIISNNKAFTLSYCFLEDIKSFVSLHDFYFTKAFNTKTNFYIIDNNNIDVSKIDKTDFCWYPKNNLNSINDAYLQKSEQKDIIVYLEDIKDNEGYTYTKTVYDSIIDIINNDNFEIVKTLNFISWCGEYLRLNPNTNSFWFNSPNMAEDYIKSAILPPCKGVQLYTDTCYTNFIPFNAVANQLGIRDVNPLNSYQLPRYNQGKWVFNYFRDVKNADDKFKYLGDLINNSSTQENKPPIYDSSRFDTRTNHYISDNNSLVEGKYFVIRFYFDDEFKLETLTCNKTNKL